MKHPPEGARLLVAGTLLLAAIAVAVALPDPWRTLATLAALTVWLAWALARERAPGRAA